MNPLNNTEAIVKVSSSSSLSESSEGSKRIDGDPNKDDCNMKVLKVICFPCNYLWMHRLYVADSFIDVCHIISIVCCCNNDERMRHDDFHKKKKEGFFPEDN